MKTLKNALLALGLVSLTAANVHAVATYTYKGNTFEAGTVSDPYTTSMFVSGSFTLADPLDSNLALTEVTPLSYSFTDGVQTLTESNSDVVAGLGFAFATGAAGKITEWSVYLYAPSQQIQTSNNATTGVLDYGYYLGDQGRRSRAPGIWTGQTESVPETGSALTLLALSLTALAGAARWLKPVVA
jgi:hypothetical protein